MINILNQFTLRVELHYSVVSGRGQSFKSLRRNYKTSAIKQVADLEGKVCLMSDCMSLKYNSLFGQISSLEDTFGCASTAYLTCSSKVLFLVSSDLPAYVTHLPSASIYHFVRFWRASSCSLLQCWNLYTSWNNLSSIRISQLAHHLNSGRQPIIWSSICNSWFTQHLISGRHPINWSSICISWFAHTLITRLHLWYCCNNDSASWLLRLHCFLLFFLLLVCRLDINAFKIEPLILPLCLISRINIAIRHAFAM